MHLSRLIFSSFPLIHHNIFINKKEPRGIQSTQMIIFSYLYLNKQKEKESQ